MGGEAVKQLLRRLDIKEEMRELNKIVKGSFSIQKKEEALKRHKKSIKDHIDSLSKKNYQKELGVKSLDGVIMFCPNEAAISTLGNSSRLMMEYAIEKKITLVGPAMLYFTLKTVEYYWRAEKQSKNTQQVIKLAEEIGSISIKVYEGAKKSVEQRIKNLIDELQINNLNI